MTADGTRDEPIHLEGLSSPYSCEDRDGSDEGNGDDEQGDQENDDQDAGTSDDDSDG